MPVVMVPLDGSPPAEAALPWAIDLAKRIGGDVRLVGVHAPHLDPAFEKHVGNQPPHVAKPDNRDSART